MCRQTSLRNLIHSLRANLYLYPLTFWTHHGDVQRLVTIGLGHTQPVPHALRIGSVHVRHDAEHLPTFLFLLFRSAIQYHANGKQIIDAFKLTFLFQHLLPDGMDGLRSALDVELEPSRLQLLLHRRNETCDVEVARLTGGAQLLLDHVIDLWLQILQRQVFQFPLDEIQTQFMCQRGIKM